MSITAIETAIANDLADGNSRTAAGKITQLIRAVIADEAAKAQQPAEPRADDPLMPNWFCEGYAADDGAIFLWRRVIDELTRRMSEATAERDRRIAELEFDVRHADCRTQSQKQWLANKDRRIAELEAECERLRNARCNIFSKGNKCDCTLCKQDAEITTLRQQLAEATRPVEDQWYAVVGTFDPVCYAIFRYDDRAETYREQFCPSGRVEKINFNPEAVGKLRRELQSERAARVAAELERDELREAVNRYATDIALSRRGSDQFFYVMDGRGAEHASPADAVLAAYRAEKGKVTK